MTKVAPQVLCMLFAVSACTPQLPAGYTDAQHEFSTNRGTFEKLLSKLAVCSFKFHERGRHDTYAIIHSDPSRSFEFGACSGDEAKTTEIAALLRKVRISYVAWDIVPAINEGNVEFIIGDQYAPDTKTRTRTAIAYSVPAIQNESDDDDGNAPACAIKVRALTSSPPYNWLWVYRKFKVDDPNRKWCEDLRVP